MVNGLAADSTLWKLQQVLQEKTGIEPGSQKSEWNVSRLVQLFIELCWSPRLHATHVDLSHSLGIKLKGLRIQTRVSTCLLRQLETT